MRSMLIVLLICLSVLVGCAAVKSFFGNPPDATGVPQPSRAENLLDKIIGIVSPWAGTVPWGGTVVAIAAAVQQFLKLRRTRKPVAAIVQAVETLRTNPATKDIWSEAVEATLVKTGLQKATLTAFANEVKARTGLPPQ